MKKMNKILCTLLVALAVAGCGVEKVENKVVTVQLANNKTITGVYTGEMRGDKPDGNGIFKAQAPGEAKFTYTGGFKKGMYDGQAVLQYEGGGRIETTYKEGKMNGKTKIYTKDHLHYDGDFVNNKSHGKGKRYNTETGKLEYDGEWKDGLRNGEGTVYKENGTVRYKGKFVNGWPDVTPAKMNETISVDNLQYSVIGTQTYDAFNNIKPQGVFYVVYLTVKNTDNRSRKSSNMIYFKDMELYTFFLTDETGKTYFVKDANREAYSKFDRALDRTLTDMHLFGFSAGATIPKLPLAFDIPKGAKGLKLWEINGIYEAPPVALQ